MSNTLPPPPPGPENIPPRPPVQRAFQDENPDDFTPQGPTSYFEVPEKKKKTNKGAIIIGGVAALAVIGTGAALAVNSLLEPKGTHAYEALPSESAFMYGEVNLDPTAEQKKSWLALSQKFDENPEGKSIRELTTTPLGDFSKVEPWIGDRIAVAGYGDLGTDGEPDAFIAYQTKDKKAAETFGESFADPYILVEDFFIITESPEGQSVLDALINKGGDRLGDNGTFKKDLDSVGEGNVLHGWLDLGVTVDLVGSDLAAQGAQLSALSGVDAPAVPPQEVPEVTGRVILSGQLNDDGVEGKVIMREVTVDGISVSESTKFTSIENEFKALPKGFAHLSVAGLDESVKALWEDETLAESLVEVEQGAQQLGLTLPEDLTKVLGNTASVSIGTAGNMLAVYGHLAGADIATWNNVGQQTGLVTGTPDGATITDTGSGVAITYGTPGTEKIGDDKAAMNALIDLDSAGSAILVDLDAAQQLLAQMNGNQSETEPLGLVGVTVGAEGSDVTVNGKWVLR